MTAITDRSERRRLAALEAKVSRLDVAIQAAEEGVTSEERNRELLDARLDKAREASKEARAAAADAAADVLVANPRASIGATLLSRFTASKADPAAEIAALNAAVAKAGRLIDKRAAEVADLKAERAAAWQEFADATHRALMAEAERRLIALHDEVTAPMRALRSSISADLPRLAGQGDDLRVEVYWREEGHLGPKRRTVIPRLEQRTYGRSTAFSSPTTRSEAVDPEPYLDKLRAELRAERG